MRLNRIYFLVFLFSIINNLAFSQNYNDGPIEIKVKLREIGNYYEGDDWSVFGTNINSEPEDFTYKLWFSDNLNIHPWIGYGPLGNPIEGIDNIINTQDDFAYTDDIVQVSLSGTNSQDFNSIVSILTYNSTLVPEFLKMKFFGWEDDNPSDPFTSLSWAGVTINNTGYRNVFESAYCQYTLPWWLGGGCAPLAFQGDDYSCDAEPFYSGLNWRYTSGQIQIPPCQFYSHGQITGSGCVNNSNNAPAPNTDTYYKPHIETMWRYTNGNSFAHAIDLGILQPLPGVSHFNSNICYSNYFNASIGNDVIYSFDINNPTGVNISLCGVNGAQFDSYLYLLFDNDTINAIEMNDNSSCGLQSQINASLCDVGTYYIVVDAVAVSDTGTFTITLTEDVNNTFFVVDSISNYNGNDISCYNGNDGKIYAKISGGSPPFIFSWTNSISNITTTNSTNNFIDSLIDLSAGSYLVNIIDSKGCSLPPLNIILDNPSEISVDSFNTTDASCYGYNDAAIFINNVVGGSPSYSYLWNTNPIQTGTNATGLLAGQYTVTVTDNNLCSINVQYIVSQPSAPVVNLNSTTNPFISTNPLTYEVCDGNDITLIASGLVSYTWSPNLWLNSTIGSTVVSSPISPGITYTCTGTDINGCEIDTFININVVSSINISSNNPNPQVCYGENVSITLNGATNYTWFPPSYLNTTTGSSVIITPLDTITYTITAENSSGCTDEIDFFVDVLPAPNILVNATSLSVCEGNSVPIIASGANSFTWSPSSDLNTNIGNVVNATPLQSTQYKVVGVNSFNCIDSSYITISVNPLPNLNIIGSNTICEGDTASLIVNGASSYIWSPANGLNTTNGSLVLATPSMSQSYIVTGTDVNSCVSSVSHSITVLSNPSIFISASNDTICKGDISLLTAGGATSYTWQAHPSLSTNTGTTTSVNPINNTIYSVTGKAANNCSSIAFKEIIVNPLPLLDVNYNTAIICQDSSLFLEVSGAMDYIWSPALGLNTTIGNLVVAQPYTSTIYSVTGIDSNNCSDVISTNISVNPKPILTLSPTSANVCQGADILIEAFGALSYSWNPSFGLSSTSTSSVIAAPSSSVNYTITGTDINNCQGTANFQLNVGVNPDINISTSNNIICEGESTSVLVNGANQYIWSPSNNLNTTFGSMVIASPDITTTYFVDAIDSLGCEDKDSITITVNQLPIANLLQDTLIICDIDTAAILIDIIGIPPFNILYSLNNALEPELKDEFSNSVIIKDNRPGDYSLISIEDNNGCISVGADDIFVEVIVTPNVDFYYSPSLKDEIFKKQIEFTNISSNASEYIWYFGDSIGSSSILESPIYEYEYPGNYQVTLVGYNSDCFNEMTHEVYIKPVFTLYIPNSFSPAGSIGINDYFPWEPCYDPLNNINDFEFFIYNRWGQQVFYSTDKCNTWDGKVNSNGEVVNGYYSYVINIVDIIGDFHTINGNVLIN